MARTKIQTELFTLQDQSYGAFQAKLIPNIDANTVIGVRTPDLRKLAKELLREAKTDGNAKARLDKFLVTLPHTYYDENQLHAFLLSEEKDFETCIEGVCEFLPYIDNWATCDQLSPKVFQKNRERLLSYIAEWLETTHTYTIRFAIGMLMQHFLDEDFSAAYPKKVAAVKSEEYYVNMMIAWYFATALAKQYDAVLPYLIEEKLDKWTHNKTIQKAVESYRISPEQKAYLKTLRRKS